MERGDERSRGPGGGVGLKDVEYVWGTGLYIYA